MNLIAPFDAHSFINEQGLLIDVSTAGEFSASSIDQAKNYPIAKLLKDLSQGQFDFPRQQKILLTCQSGNRAQRAAKELKAAGFEVLLLKGGNQAWESAQLPMIRGEGVISLERQVRIVTGGLGLLGSLLAVFVAPLFIIIPIIIGAGLLNAGITNWCGMGMLLAKMPWNTSLGTRS